MKFNVYAVWDAIAAESMTIFASKTDGMAVRENLPTLARMRPVKDMTLYKIGEYDNEKCEITPCAKQSVSWDAYKFPEAQSKITKKKPEQQDNQDSQDNQEAK